MKMSRGIDRQNSGALPGLNLEFRDSLAKEVGLRVIRSIWNVCSKQAWFQCARKKPCFDRPVSNTIRYMNFV
jgi:hypothetical protein